MEEFVSSFSNSSMRGASILGVVALLALISMTAISLDRLPLGSETSQVAATSGSENDKRGCAKNPDGTTVCGGFFKGDGGKYENLTCQSGNDFVLKKSETGELVVFYAASQKGYSATQAGKCTQPADVINGQRCGTLTPQQSATWKCRITDCSFPATGNVPVACSDKAPKEGPVGAKIAEAVSLATSQSEGLSSDASKIADTLNDPNASEDAKQEALSKIPYLPTQDQQQLNSIFTEDKKEVEEAIAANDTRLAEIQACYGPKVCSESLSQLQDEEVRRKLEAEQLKARLDYLDGAKAVLGVNCPGTTQLCGTDVKPPLGQPPPQNQPAYNPWTGSPGVDPALVSACQSGYQPACQQVSISAGYGLASVSGNDPYCVTSLYPLMVQQYPARPGCYNYNPNANPYGTSQCGIQQGGLIGTIVSLFRKDSNNCDSYGNGSNAPTPTCRITASSQNITSGQQVTLQWQSQQAYQASLSSAGNVAPNGDMTVNPQTTTTYTLNLGGYMDNRTGQQLRGQCSVQVVVDGQGGGDGAPKAEISCRPQEADVGMSIAVSFACHNSATSVGAGFSTNNQLSGSATPIVAVPTLGSDSVTYGLTCSKEGKTDSAQCVVEINTPSIVLIANPQTVESGRPANLGWITSGMDACTISSPILPDFTSEHAGNTSTSGVVKTPALTEDTEFELSCTTKSGSTKTAKTVVKVD